MENLIKLTGSDCIRSAVAFLLTSSLVEEGVPYKTIDIHMILSIQWSKTILRE
jgi:hypothetical protein